MQDVLFCEFVGIGNLDALPGSIYEQGAVVFLGLLEDHDAGGNAGPKEKVVRELDDAVYIVIINQILSYLLLCSSSIHHTREAYYGSRAIAGEPGKRVHNECKVSLGLGRKHARRGKSRVIDKGYVIISFPFG